MGSCWSVGIKFQLCCRSVMFASLPPPGLHVARQDPLSMGFPRQELLEWVATPSSRESFSYARWISSRDLLYHVGLAYDQQNCVVHLKLCSGSRSHVNLSVRTQPSEGYNDSVSHTVSRDDGMSVTLKSGWCYHGCMLVSKLMKLHSLNTCSLPYINYTSIKLLEEGRDCD